MGTGKTTIGRAVASALGWCFRDTDEEIEIGAAQTIREIFVQHGEAHFRELENREIRKQVRFVEAGNPCVLALGGGAFVQPNNYELLQHNGVTIWLDCGFDHICERVNGDSSRPLAADRENLLRLYESRRPLYARADFRICVEERPTNEITRDILDLPIF